MIELKKGCHYHGVWNASFTGGDFMGIQWLENGEWWLKYRLRYYADERVWESKDRRSWYEMHQPDGPGVKEKIHGAMEALMTKAAAAGMLDSGAFIECNGDAEAMAKILTSPDRGQFHHKQMTKEQAEAYERTNTLPEGMGEE